MKLALQPEFIGCCTTSAVHVVGLRLCACVHVYVCLCVHTLNISTAASSHSKEGKIVSGMSLHSSQVGLSPSLTSAEGCTGAEKTHVTTQRGSLKDTQKGGTCVNRPVPCGSSSLAALKGGCIAEML